MKNIFFPLFFLLFFAAESRACDTCNLYEYTSLNNRSFLGMFLRYRVFNGYSHRADAHRFRWYPSNARLSHEPEDYGMYVDKTAYDYETYLSYELRGNFTWKEKVNFQFILPHETNTVYYRRALNFPQPEGDTTFLVQGWGDLTLAADYLWQRQTGKVTHLFRPGIGVRLPIGAYQKAGTDGRVYDPILQPGTSAFAAIFRFNYLCTYRNSGLMTFVNYQVSTLGKNTYQFANSLNAGADVFQQFFLGDVALVPRLGGYFEQADRDRFEGETQQLTGGRSIFGNVGLDINFQKWTLQTTFQQPLAQRLHGNQIGNAGRWMVGVIRGF